MGVGGCGECSWQEMTKAKAQSHQGHACTFLEVLLESQVSDNKAISIELTLHVIGSARFSIGRLWDYSSIVCFFSCWVLMTHCHCSILTEAGVCIEKEAAILTTGNFPLRANRFVREYSFIEIVAQT